MHSFRIEQTRGTHSVITYVVPKKSLKQNELEVESRIVLLEPLKIKLLPAQDLVVILTWNNLRQH